MKTEQPLWGRGVMISPQHFQQQAAYAAWSAECIARLGLSHPWGMIEATFEPDTLKLGRLQARHLHIRFPDGTLIDTDNADDLPPVLALEGESQEVVVVLALPLLRANGGNCLKPDEVAERPVRYRQRWRDIRNTFGDDTRQIAVMQPELTLRFAHQNNSDYLTCPVARLQQDSQGNWALDETFLPPLLALQGSRWLVTQLEQLMTQLRARLSRLMDMRRESNERKTVAFPAELPWFEIDVVLAERWEHDFSFTEKHLRLNCVPVINLFPLESDPLTLNSLQTEYMLRPMRVQDGHTEIYAVNSVMSSSQHTYVPFSSFRHKGGMMRHEAPEYYYHTRIRRGPSGLHNTWLILGGEAFDNHTVPEDESLSLTLTGTNGQLPRRALQSTVLDTVMKTTSASIGVRNLCAPTLPCYPPAQDRFHWRVLSHLGSGFLSMMDNADVLRGTLALYEWTDSEMNRRRLEAIIDVKHSETERFEQGYLVRGVQIEVTLDSHGFAGRGDICLFGEMLSRFFALYTDIYLFNRLIIILQPTGERLEWEEKHNRRIPG